VTVIEKLREQGLALPAPTQPPPGAVLPFVWVRVVDRRVLVSGHGPTDDAGRICPPFGKVGREVTVEQGYAAARRVALAMLASLHAELGDLDRIDRWVRVFGMVSSAPGFDRQPAVVNGFSDLVLALFGPDRGQHARSAVGMAELPFGMPVEIEAELLLRS
jgi:enamine deaminase RidA (YjgF/YER057c/UK114 family)